MRKFFTVALLIIGLVLAVKANAAVHGIGYHHVTTPLHCRSYNFKEYWWVGNQEYDGCSASLQITVGG